MISPFSLFCMKCEGLFGSDRKPTTGNCGHTFCAECVEGMEKCARCDKKAAFSNCVVNYDLLKLVENVKENVFQYFDYWHGQFGEDSDLDSGICDTCSAFCSKLRICKDCCLERGTLSDNNLEGDLHLVLAHGVTIHTVSKHFERYCGDCILEGRTLHTDHKTIPTSKISKYSIGMHQMSIIAFSYHVLRKTILEIVGDKCESVNSFFQELSRALVNLRIHWHCENSFRFYDGDWNDEKKLEADIKRIHEKEERSRAIGRLRNILIEAGIPLSRIPAGIQKGNPKELAELEEELQKLRTERECKFPVPSLHNSREYPNSEFSPRFAQFRDRSHLQGGNSSKFVDMFSNHSSRNSKKNRILPSEKND